MASWTNWSGRVSCAPAEIARPRSEAEIAETVRRAHERGLGVRVVGTGHSFSPLVATDGVLISLDEFQGVESIDAQAGEAWIRAGSKLKDLGEPLIRAGLCFANLGDVDVQALGGALGTGTHGTGPALGNLSTAIRGLNLVTPQGEIVEWKADDQSLPLAAARVSLGLLGVVTRVRYGLLPSYRLHQRIWHEPVDACTKRLAERVAAHRGFEFFWMPHDDSCEVKAHDVTDAAPESVAGREGERIDYPSRVLPSVRELRFNEMEYAIPAQAGPACFGEVRKRMKQRHPQVVWPIEYRTLAADDGWLSPAHGRASVTISAHQDARRPCDELFRDLETIFAAHGGRPHWGKLHYRSGPELAALYPLWERFRALRARLDPDGCFLNDWLRGIFSAPL